jgi:hypothetical protein
MDQQLARLEQQQAALQAELSQLAETLTSSKQANVVARAKVAAAASETAAELQAAQVRMSLLRCTSILWASCHLVWHAGLCRGFSISGSYIWCTACTIPVIR